ncbi:hypothetical protein GCM10016234_02980 [Tianweitania populi]|uniref:Uncharacterized protein n=1 Tax=Tianweitania populi TaxID=1607949 RepID=A0A8J3GJ69_9HYPH|nr:hypothetical protein GCM10016234_02980 [Tianweitania populi]
MINSGNVVGAMVFDLEQIGMRLQHFQSGTIVLQPAACRKDRCRNVVGDQRVENARIGLTATRIERHSHPQMVAVWKMQGWFNQLLGRSRTEGDQKGKD